MAEHMPAAGRLEIRNGLDLVVCGLSEIDGALDAGVTHVVSILDPGFEEPACLARLGADALLRLRFHDIIEELPAQDAPAAAHIAALLEFGAAFAAAKHRALVHCHMGISRSTAAAIVLLAEHHGDPEAAVAQVSAIRPVAWPNLRMIELADAHLGLDGRLVGAVRRHHAAALRRRPELREAFIRHGRAREVDGLETLG